MARQATADTDRIDFGDVTCLDDPNDTKATWACWVMIDSWASTDAYAFAWGKQSSAGGTSWVPVVRDPNGGAGTANFFGSMLNGGTSTVAIDANSYTWTEGVWHFYAAVWTNVADTLTLYASLEHAGSLTTAGSGSTAGAGNDLNPTPANTPLTLFQREPNTFNFRGRFAHLAIFTDDLTEAELLTYRDNPSTTTTNRCFYAPLEGDSPEPDEDGGFDGTVTGTNVVAGPSLTVGVPVAWLTA